MRRLLICLGIILSFTTASYAAIVPDIVQNAIKTTFPQTNFRFDGLIILPDNTVYLPVLPAKIINPDKLTIKTTLPTGKSIADKPDVIIFNNDFALLKVLIDSQGNKTVCKIANPPIELRTGLLPQNMLIPKGLIIPDNLNSIVGGLEINSAKMSKIKVENVKPNIDKLSGTTLKTLSQIPQLKNKSFYASSPYSRNIQVYNSSTGNSQYTLTQSTIPINMKASNNEFLLVTSFDKPSVDVISLADNQIIKQISTKTQPDEIVIDYNKKIAYISTPDDCSIYTVNLENMTLTKQIRISGMCEKLTLSNDGSKLFYYDKKTNEIWAVELDNNYLLKEIGKFPNVSKIIYANDKIYITSRTKDRLAIIDYNTIGLIGETEICDKPVDMLEFHNRLYILGAGDNSIQILNTKTDEVTNSIYLNTNGFSTKIYNIENTNIAIITDTKASLCTIFDLGTNKVIKTIPLDLPINTIVVTDKRK